MPNPFMLDSRIVVATHHKAGTTYSRNVFAQICREFGWTLCYMQTRLKPDVWDIAYHEDATSERLREALRGRCKLLHFVRHPKSLIVSGVRYHLDAEEGWLDRPEQRFGGRSYRQVLRSLESPQERIRFEMRNKARRTIEEMLELESAAVGVPRMTVKLEDVSRDSSRRKHVELLTFMGFAGEPLSRALAVCVRHALWSMDKLPAHARGGVDDDWKLLFTPELDAEFESLFGDAEAALGYRRPPFPTVRQGCRPRRGRRHGQPPVIWLRTPKCAGTSIEETLQDAELLSRDGPALGKILMVPGEHAASFRERYPDHWRRAWKFAVVRNPWDRFVSGWKYVAAERHLRDLLLNLPERSDFHRWHHLTRSQSEFLVDERDRLIPDCLVRFERLQEDMNECFDRIGVPRLVLRHEKRGHGRPDYREYYDEETRDLVARIFRRDIELFGYQF